MPNVKARNLACPLDGLPLLQSDKQFSCESGHSFDLARQGYLNLLPVQYKASKSPGDNKHMVVARSGFLELGLYEPIAEKLLQMVMHHVPGMKNNSLCILDAGCGEGYYLDYLGSRLVDQNSDIELSCIGIDISRFAILAASKRNKKLTWLVATNKNIPVLSSSVDIVLCMFGFPSYQSFHRVLKPGGILIMVETGPRHLIELRKLIYPQIKPAKPYDSSTAEQHGLAPVDEQQLEYTIDLKSNETIMQLMGMTPHLYRAGQEGKQKLSGLQATTTTVDVVYRVLRKC